MGGDPLPERRKWLRVLYCADGERHNVVVEEKNELRLPKFLRMQFFTSIAARSSTAPFSISILLILLISAIDSRRG
jgi:hypothetical protein